MARSRSLAARVGDVVQGTIWEVTDTWPDGVSLLDVDRALPGVPLDSVTVLQTKAERARALRRTRRRG